MTAANSEPASEDRCAAAPGLERSVESLDHCDAAVFVIRGCPLTRIGTLQSRQRHQGFVRALGREPSRFLDRVYLYVTCFQSITYGLQALGRGR